MQEMTWLETHLGSIDGAVKIVNEFAWKLGIEQHNQTWYVTTGEEEKTVIFSADTREAVDAFLYGMGLAYVGIPTPFFEQLAKDVKTWHESQ